jgi:hypothetical protein
MEKFMLVFHSPQTQEAAFMEMSPQAVQAEIQKWNVWIGGIAEQGKFIGTDALAPVGKTMTKGGQVVTDGPFTEGKEIVGGYMLLNAKDIDEAVELSKGCPLFDSNGTVEVRPIIKFE